MTAPSTTDTLPHPSAAAPDPAEDALLTGETAHRLVQHAGTATLLAASALVRAQGPTTGPDPEDLADRFTAVDLDRPLGSTEAALAEAAGLYLDDAVYFHHPRYAAHLNCPVALPAVAAEALVTSINTSMDTWDQSAGATLVERRLVDWAAGRCGLGATADGVFTSGGTQSNLQALLVARNRAVAGAGPLPGRLAGWRVYASADSHFSIVRSAAQLGLGAEAVVRVPVDRHHRMDAVALERAVERDRAAGLRPLAIVATAGTTDFGAIDPLEDAADVARGAGAWFHVDAAYGCGLLASPTRRHLLDGIERADSVTVDFHKSFFQPIGSSALLLRDGAHFAYITHHADYLNPHRDPASPNQVDKSLQTTRRFDALKLWVTLRTVGPDALGRMFDTVIDLAAQVADGLRVDSRFELVCEPSLSTVLFRWLPPAEGPAPVDPDPWVRAIRRAVWDTGRATVAETEVAGRPCLKLTLLNPDTTLQDVQDVLELVHETALTLTQRQNTGKACA